jgi:hypothetical protein
MMLTVPDPDEHGPAGGELPGQQAGLEAQQPVCADVGQGAGQDGGHRRRGAAVDAGQPEMEREQAQLDPEGDEEQHGDDHRGVGIDAAGPGGHRQHLQGAGGPVQPGGSDQEQERAEQVDHGEDQRRADHAPLPAERGQGVAGHHGQLEEHIEAEHVACQEQPGQADRQEQHQGREQPW